MGKIELELTCSSLLQYANSAMQRDQWYLAVQNLNDAFDKAETDEDIKKVFLAYADLFLNVNNYPLSRYALFMASKKEYKGGFFYLDHARFLPEAPYPVEEENEYELTAGQVLSFNRVYTLILERKYAEAIKLFYTLPFNRKSMASVVDALSVALNTDRKFDLDSYIVPLLPIIGEYASGDAEFINILLSGGENTRLLAVEGAKFFIDDNEDVDLLRDMGEVFFLASEFETAKAFFEKVLSLCEIDEVSLYYMYALSSALKDHEQAAKYRARYFTVCRFAMPPMRLVDLSASSTKKNKASEYLSLTGEEERNLYKTLMLSESVDENNFVSVKDFFAFTNIYMATDLLEHFAAAKDRETLFALGCSVLESAFVGKDVKSAVLSFLIDKGFEGVLTYNTPDKGVICELSALHHRYGIWNSVYYKVTELILEADFFLPYYSNVLAGVIKRCKEKIVSASSEDVDFLIFMSLLSYANRLNENVSMSDVASLAALSPGRLEECLELFGLESPIV